MHGRCAGDAREMRGRCVINPSERMRWAASGMHRVAGGVQAVAGGVHGAAGSGVHRVAGGVHGVDSRQAAPGVIRVERPGDP